jgi:hypothetical protein
MGAMTTTIRRPAPTWREQLLVGHLQLAVPTAVDAAREWSSEERMERAKLCAQFIAEHGDSLQFGGPKCREALDRLIEGIAIAALQPGGIVFCGNRWIADGDDRLLVVEPVSALWDRLDMGGDTAQC